MHKCGQIVTIDQEKYKITKCDDYLVCKHCDLHRKTACLQPYYCVRYIPHGSVLKLIKPKQ